MAWAPLRTGWTVEDLRKAVEDLAGRIARDPGRQRDALHIRERAKGLVAVERIDAGLQIVMPGAEQDTLAPVRNRADAGSMAGKPCQRPADFGIFDVASRGQTDLLALLKQETP